MEKQIILTEKQFEDIREELSSKYFKSLKPSTLIVDLENAWEQGICTSDKQLQHKLVYNHNNIFKKYGVQVFYYRWDDPNFGNCAVTGEYVLESKTKWFFDEEKALTFKEKSDRINGKFLKHPFKESTK